MILISVSSSGQEFGLNFAFIDGLVHYHTLMDNLQNLDHGSLLNNKGIMRWS